jgi:hypothetical protein
LNAEIELEVPQDRLPTFDPQLIAKYQRRFPGFDEKIISMNARGMSTPKQLARRCLRGAVRPRPRRRRPTTATSPTEVRSLTPPSSMRAARG